MTQLEELLKILDELIHLLESDGETHWSHWMRRSRDRLLNLDYSGIEKLLSAYGGWVLSTIWLFAKVLKTANSIGKENMLRKTTG